MTAESLAPQISGHISMMTKPASPVKLVHAGVERQSLVWEDFPTSEQQNGIDAGSNNWEVRAQIF